MKHGVQITTTDDGAWSVSQLVQATANGEFSRTGGVVFVDHSKVNADHVLVEVVKKGLSGDIKGTSGV